MKSIWNLTSSIKQREKLNKDLSCDILIVGAGLTGILTAYYLQKEGKNVVVVDRSRIGQGVTKNTAAKISVQHGYLYHNLIKKLGYDKSYLYAKANQEALNEYNRLVGDEKIDCDFEKSDSYLYTRNKPGKIEKEYKAITSLGLQASLTNKCNLPIDIELALKMDNQAQFNPLKFISAISDKLTIYEQTKIISVEQGVALTSNNFKINAKHIIIATHYPFIKFPGLYFLKMWQERSYLITLKNATPVKGMYLDENKQGHTFRDYQDKVIFGGKSHKSGEHKGNSNYQELINESKKLFPNSEVVSTFSAQDCFTLDSLPYIGRYSKRSDNLYVATGYKKWGMTLSMVAALLLKDLILGKKNEYESLFSPQRSNILASLPSFIYNAGSAFKGLIIKRLMLRRKDIRTLEEGQALTLRYRGKNMGVYKKRGHLYFVNITCPHLKCILKWNKDELSWDCPCHGSRFDYTGKQINTPAVSDATTNSF